MIAKEISFSFMTTDDTKTSAERIAEVGGLCGPLEMSMGTLIERMAVLDPAGASGLHKAFKDAGWSREDFKSTRVLLTPDMDSDDDGKTTTFKDSVQIAVRGSLQIPGWTPSNHYADGERVTGPNPLRWYDRLLIWLGFKRWSPATIKLGCVETWPPMPERSIHE